MTVASVAPFHAPATAISTSVTTRRPSRVRRAALETTRPRTTASDERATSSTLVVTNVAAAAGAAERSIRTASSRRIRASVAMVRSGRHGQTSRQVRPFPHRIPARRRRADRPVQLALGAPARRDLHPSHRGHRPGPLHEAGRGGDLRGAALARARLGRGAGHRRSARAVLPDGAPRSVRVPRAEARRRKGRRSRATARARSSTSGGRRPRPRSGSSATRAPAGRSRSTPLAPTSSGSGCPSTGRPGSTIS